MYTIAYNPSYFKIIIILLLAVVYGSAVHYFISYFFIHSTLITSIIILFTLLVIIKAIGLFIMFPGSYRYIAAMVQKSQNDHLLNSIRRDMQSIQRISIKIINWDLKTLKERSYELQSTYAMICINTQLNVLKKNYTSEQPKIELINSYRNLISNLNKEFSLQLENINENTLKSISISNIITNPNDILSLNLENTLMQLKSKAEKCLILSRSIWKQCEKISKISEHPLKVQNIQGTYKIQQNQTINMDKFQIANWHMFTDKLFTMSSYFGYWDDIFVYSRVMVPVTNSDFIQCVVIHGQKQKKLNQSQGAQQPIKKQFPKKAVLICNPNGAFLQAFGLSSSYVNFYIRWGFQVVLWNYRGYGQSTGIPSVPKCISDVEKVYKYVNNKFKLKIRVVHGYSIGGISAINLVHKINSQGRQPIKLLVADRTFSSLDKVAQGFFRKNNMISRFVRKISKPFVKALFISECTDNSTKYIQCKCFKVCIFDMRDQIINSSASLKYGLVHNALEASNQSSQQPSNQSQRFVQLNNKEASLLEQAQSFSNSICHLFKTNKLIYEKVVKALYDTDGGGERIYIKIASTQLNIQQKSIQQMKQSYIIYLTSLMIFGPRYCLPYHFNQKQQQKWIQDRLQERISSIKQNLDPNKDNTDQIHIRSIIKSLQYAKNQLKGNQRLKNKNKYGRLIVTDIGHNSQIKRQYILLENALRNSVYLSNKKTDIVTQQNSGLNNPIFQN